MAFEKSEKARNQLSFSSVKNSNDDYDKIVIAKKRLVV